jgi:hypothetical protein
MFKKREKKCLCAGYARQMTTTHVLLDFALLTRVSIESLPENEISMRVKNRHKNYKSCHEIVPWWPPLTQ